MVSDKERTSYQSELMQVFESVSRNALQPLKYLITEVAQRIQSSKQMEHEALITSQMRCRNNSPSGLQDAVFILFIMVLSLEVFPDTFTEGQIVLEYSNISQVCKQ